VGLFVSNQRNGSVVLAVGLIHSFNGHQSLNAKHMQVVVVVAFCLFISIV